MTSRIPAPATSRLRQPSKVVVAAPVTARPARTTAATKKIASASGAATVRAAPAANAVAPTAATAAATAAAAAAAEDARVWREAAQNSASKAESAYADAQRLSELLSELQVDHDSLTTEHDSTVKNLRAASQENTQLLALVADKTAQIATLTSSLNNTSDKLQASVAENAEKTAEIGSLNFVLKGTNEKLAASMSESASRAQRIAELEQYVSELEQKRREDEVVRRKLHNTIQELKGNIRVYCRVRPPSQDEQNDLLVSEGLQAVSVMAPEGGEVRKLELAAPPTAHVTGCGPDVQKKWPFAFDKVFDGAASQDAVFEDISQLVTSAMDGYQVCVFAYGQTGSGKTYTMEGGAVDDFEHRGMIPRAVEQIFASMSTDSYQDFSFEMKASFLEIYNEQIRDLLAPESSTKKWEIKYDKQQKVYVTDLTLADVSQPSEVYQLLRQAAQNRAVAKTAMNERSSRSHSVFQLHLKGTNKVTSEVTEGVLNLIDLAGSERLARSGAVGAQLKETQAINKSLSCLGDVIVALANRDAHVPYRNSKLTHLLQNSLGGDAKTLMFVNIAPTASNMSESLCSLRFASKVNSCDIGVARRAAKITEK
eukprot:TRINITY_DN3073_c0_g1_i1.p1 TRINITY_DN3073_c0_g1~~TRINITY_DN3073_c0_g1_i1.p1  ORF type:complete len:670 (-),score=189.73 TRINITY_DN3073_c0_g1_i1:154-1944(-)